MSYDTRVLFDAFAVPECPASADIEHVGADLERRVRLRFAKSNLPALRTVTVETDGDCVILSGQVASFYERQLAISLSRHVAGVLLIIDKIQVQ